MMTTIQNTILRNIKYVPYFFRRESTYSSKHYSYALLGKLSASIIHDILTPINTLSLVSELNNKEQSNLEPIIKNSTNQIKEYVEIMKNFISPQHTRVSHHVNSEIMKCITLLTYKAHHNNVSIQFIEFDQIYCKIDPIHIYQIVINLLSNAIEASTDCKTKKVILILKKNKKDFIFECKDFGKGISKDKLSTVCKPYFTTKQTGTGLGLYSVTNILSSCLDGELSIQSEPHKGSLFSCTIPLVK